MFRRIPALTARDGARFLAKVAPADENGCRLWTGSTNGSGYGKFGVANTVILSHRIAYTLSVGPIPDGLEIDHFTCFNHACCTPEHLRPSTHKHNTENREGARAGSASGVRGVSRKIRAGRVWWIARVIHDGREHSFGIHPTIEEAGAAVTAGRLSLFTHNEVDRRTQ